MWIHAHIPHTQHVQLQMILPHESVIVEIQSMNFPKLQMKNDAKYLNLFLGMIKHNAEPYKQLNTTWICTFR